MSGFAPGNIPAILPAPAAALFPDAKEFEVEKLCPLSLIRSHTKSDDIIAVTDDQLIMYRQSALENAEKYTGLKLGKVEQMREMIQLPVTLSHDIRKIIRHRLKYAVADNYVYIIGPGVQNRMFVEQGVKRIKLGNVFHAHDFHQCCRPCNADGTPRMAGDSAFNVLYRAGYNCASEVPRGVVLGMLKFIAWNIANPGDVYQSVRFNASRGTGAQDGTNNPAWASGALEEWRVYVDDIT